MTVKWGNVGNIKLSASAGNADAQFDQLSRYLKVIETEVYKEASEQLRVLAEQFRESLKQAVYYQSLRLTPLSEHYKKRKEKLELDSRILIRTGEYIESIDIVEAQESQGLLVISVTHPDTIHSEAKISLRLLARILEFGSISRNIPARPHWRPVMEEFLLLKGKIAEKTVEEVAKKVRKSLQKKFGDTNS